MESASERRARAVAAHQGRLEVVRRVRALGVAGQASFARLARLAARTLRTPLAGATLVEREHQLTLGLYGFDDGAVAAALPLDEGFGPLVLACAGPVAIGDVDASPALRARRLRRVAVAAYLGVPIRVSGGHVIGVLAVMDTRPRAWTDEDAECLADLAASVATEVELALEVAERRHSERRFRGFFATLGLGVALVDLDDRILEVNASLAATLGHAPEALRGLAVGDLTHPDDRERDRERFAALAAGPSACHPLEVRWLHRDGAPVPGRMTVSLVCDADGRPQFAVRLFEDLSDRRRAEEARLRSEARFESIVSIAADAILTVDERQRITFFNQGAERIFGYRAAEVLGQDLGLLLPERLRERHAALVRGFGREGATRRMGERGALEILGRRKNGEAFPAEVSISSVQVAGETIHTALLRDATERRRAEAELRKSEARLAEAHRIARLGHWEWTIDTGALYWSEEIYRIFGRPRDGTAPTYAEFLERVHPEDRALVERAVASALDAGVPYEIDHRIVRSDGAERVVHEQGVVVREDGRPARMVGTVQDVTEWWRAERALEESRRRLDQARKMEAVGRLAGGVAHDFNNLLTVIKSYAQIALFQLAPGDDLRADVEAIDAAADRAAALTRQLLAFSRRQVLKPEVVDLGDVVADTEKMLRRLIGEHVALRTALDPAAGPVLADRHQLEQVLVNLAVNARDAMPGGGVLTLRTDAVRVEDAPAADLDTPVEAGPYVRLTVEDTGHGMDAETLAHVFEPFFTTKEDGKGTGLGLSTVYGIVRQSGGFVRVASEPGRGTRFEVHLPRAEGAPRPRAPERLGSGAGEESILVVEDEEAVRTLVRRTLLARGYTVHEAASGAEALALHAALPAPVDLLLTDVVMPGPSGKALADALVARQPGLRVLYMSGYTEDEIVDRGVLRAGVRLLDKPFSPDALACAVRAALGDPPTTDR